MSDERPKVGQTWIQESTGLWWQCTKAWPHVEFERGYRRRLASERALASGAWRRVS